jgi:hypothetical protein
MTSYARFRKLLLQRPLAAVLTLAAAGTLTLAPAAADAAPARPMPPRLVYGVTFAADSALYRLYPRSHRAVLAGRAGTRLTDLAFRHGILYAISFTALYRLSPASGARHKIGSLGITAANALATQPGTDALYGTDQHGEFFRVNPRTGRAAVIGRYGHGLGSSGDLVFANHRLYATVTRPHSAESILATVNVRTGAARIVGRTGYHRVWGLVAAGRQLYGATSAGSFLAISAWTGRARVIWREGLDIGGLTTVSPCPWAGQATVC